MRQLLRRFLYLVRRTRLEADLAEEMEFHREMTREEMHRRGLAPDEAAFATRRALGNDTVARDQARDVWIPPFLQDLSQDIRFAARLLVKDKRFTIAVVIALAMPLGINSSWFGIVNAALIRDVPFERPDRLVAVRTIARDGDRAGVSYPDLLDLRAASRSFSDLAATAGGSMILSDEQAPERFRGSYVSVNTLRTLRVAPLLGRGFLPEDEKPGAPPVVILGYAVWQGRYGGDPGLVGRTVRVNNVPSTVVGIMPAGFTFPSVDNVWQPLSLSPAVSQPRRDNRSLAIVGRLADSVDLTQARAEVDAIVGRLAAEYPATNKGLRPLIIGLKESYIGPARPIIFTLTGAIALVLLIACANVANLLLARAVNRSREIAIRASLGATRWRIVRQLLIECTLLASIAAALGFAISLYGVKVFGLAFNILDADGQAARPYWVDLSVNEPTLVFVTALCLATSLAFGLVPALHVSRSDVNDTLKDGSRGAGTRAARRWSGAFVVAEITLTLILLTGAGLMWRSFAAHYRTDLVIDTAHIVSMRVTLPREEYRTAQQLTRFFDALDERLASKPILANASLASNVPLAAFPAVRTLSIAGRPAAAGARPSSVFFVAAGDRYFETLGLQVLRGRTFIPGDSKPGTEGVVVDQRFVSNFFGGADSVGHRIRLAGRDSSESIDAWLTIVGVVPTVPQFLGDDSAHQGMVYVPLRVGPTPPRSVLVLVRSSAGVSAVTPVVREEVRAVDPNLPVFGVQTVGEAVARTRTPLRMVGIWIACLALIALGLASIGLYAITAHGVAQRTQEIGVRMALGAQASGVVWLFLRRTALQLAVGLTIGLSGALFVGQLLHMYIHGTNPRDPLTLAVVTTLLVGVALLASLLPARRAARIDPVVALRYE